MRTIRKGIEPRSLAQHRHTPGANYENYLGKEDLRSSLVTEQRGLCCYCLSRIHPSSQKMKIAHWRPQSQSPAERLDYGNLLGACKGNEGQPRKTQHCDTRQGNSALSRNPANPEHRVEDLIRFEGDGRIKSTDNAFDTELNEVLNLNAAFLMNNRKATLNAFTGALRRNGPLRRNDLQRWLAKWNGDSAPGHLEPYCQVVVYWLRKRLARA